MKLWTRVMLIAWLLSGLLAAPAMAFGMKCHSGAGTQDVSPMQHSAMSMDGHGDHHAPDHGQAKDSCALSCLAHCLSASGIILCPQPFPADTSGAPLLTMGWSAPLEGQALGPPLEPPIVRLV
jgi:hypothetical protein